MTFDWEHASVRVVAGLAAILAPRISQVRVPGFCG